MPQYLIGIKTMREKRKKNFLIYLKELGTNYIECTLVVYFICVTVQFCFNLVT